MNHPMSYATGVAHLFFDNCLSKVAFTEIAWLLHSLLFFSIRICSADEIKLIIARSETAQCR